jgi:hypothetical protein
MPIDVRKEFEEFKELRDLGTKARNGESAKRRMGETATRRKGAFLRI